MQKIKFKEALEITGAVRRIFISLDLPNDITIDEMKVLNILNLNEPNNLKEIKENIIKFHNYMDRQKIEVRFSKKIATLLEKGLITKTKNIEDKRIFIIKLTSKGKKVVNSFLEAAEEKWKGVFND